MDFDNTLEFARRMDLQDPLKDIRNQFIIPEEDGRQKIYFLGNSLGLQPRRASEYIQRILQDWSQLGVEGFFQANEPWMNYHDYFLPTVSQVIGALPEEIVVMNQLTVNLHLLLVSFYRPSGRRTRIICEAKAFPSDQYTFETHVRHHGLDPETVIVEVSPRPGEHTLRTEDILRVIEENREETALILFGGINYYTGQLFDIPAITKAGRSAGAMVGFDLAHAAGNVELQLHDWGVDFACWCNYKYLNSGPGAIGGAFIHRRHHQSDLIRFAGWWGYDLPTRFKMEKGFKAMPGAQGWQLSTPSLLLYATHRAALEIVAEAGWNNIQAKRILLNNYLWHRLREVNEACPETMIEFITPADEQARGSQVSMLMLSRGRYVYDQLMKNGMMVDWREPNVIRLAPVPLYNTFEEVWSFTDKLKEILIQSTNS